jgi:uncharacterized protein
MLACLDESARDRGPRKVAAETARLCIVTREVKPIDDMIRFVVGPDHAVVPDLKRKLPGRGVWVTARRDVLADAIRRQAFPRGFKADVAVSKDLLELVEQLLERSVLDALAIAHKGGAAVAGFTKVESAIETDRIVALAHAREAGADGCRKIAAAINRRFGEGAEAIVTMAGFSSSQLDLALGRANVIHAALLASRASDTVLARWRVLDRFRIGDPEQKNSCNQPDSGAPKLGLE